VGILDGDKFPLGYSYRLKHFLAVSEAVEPHVNIYATFEVEFVMIYRSF